MGFFSEQPAVQDRLHRPLPMVGSGGPAASTFCESLVDADAAALKRLRFAQNVSLTLPKRIFHSHSFGIYLKSLRQGWLKD